MVTTLIDQWPSNGFTMNHLTLNKIWLLISLKKSLLLVITEGNSIFILSWETIGSGPIFSFFRDLRTRLSMHYSLLYTDPCLIQWIPKDHWPIRSSTWILQNQVINFLDKFFFCFWAKNITNCLNKSRYWDVPWWTVASNDFDSNSGPKPFLKPVLRWFRSDRFPGNVITNLMFTNFKIIFMRFSLLVFREMDHVAWFMNHKLESNQSCIFQSDFINITIILFNLFASAVSQLF